MLAITLGNKNAAAKHVLCLGAHCDDIEIGCGATVLRLAEENPGLSFTWVVFSSSAARAEEARHSADKFLQQAQQKNILIKDFRNGFFPYIGAQIKEFFEQLKQDTNPDLIFTHYRHDLHQDHRLINELTWNTFRNHFILEYEIPKYDGDLGVPNFFIDVDRETYARKIDTIIECFASQRDKHWFTPDTFQAIARLRGMESNAASGYAEAFYCRKALY